MKKLFYLVLFFALISCHSEVDNPSVEGSLSGKFSVSSSKKVQFSKGNLQYCPLTETWQFAAEQYSVIGKENSNISATYDGWIDLFGWGTGSNPCLSSLNNEDYTTFAEWGNNLIRNGGNKAAIWRTLSAQEWQYLLTERTGAEQLYAAVDIEAIQGLLILPDGWSDLKNIPLKKGTESFQSSYPLSLHEWARLQEAGAVLLPIGTGKREGVNVIVNKTGSYWSSSLDSNSAAQMLSVGMNRQPMIETDIINNVPARYQGCAVRLVCDVK